MSKDNFAGGFIAGAVFGGIVGGVLGALLTSARYKSVLSGDDAAPADNPALKRPNETNIETARRGLENKIAQLNEAIDDVRQQLGHVNGNVEEKSSDRSLSREL